MTIEKFNRTTRPGLYLLLVLALLSTSCGSNKLIRGESPAIRITELSHRDNNITLQLNIRNLNGVDLNVQSIDFRLTANEENDELIAYSGPVGTNIVANGTESWSVEVAENDTDRRLLEQLENGKIMSLPYQLKGSISSADDGTMRFEYEGHLYPQPGKPGHFR